LPGSQRGKRREKERKGREGNGRKFQKNLSNPALPEESEAGLHVFRIGG
jgi:hypothetical protein